MEYHQAINRLEGLRRLRPKLGTKTTADLLDHHGRPHEELTAVQIAGSNGKGSTATILDAICQEAGLNVGLYTSPDLNDLRERIRVGGQKIPKHEVTRFVEESWPYILEESADEDAPTFFEVVTAMAFWHFNRQDVDLAVLEVGIGGRYDATSVVTPAASAVTTVSLEHTDILGGTVEEIARDKAHVAPADSPLVTGATGDALDAIRETTNVVTVTGESTVGAAQTESRIERPEESVDVRATETEMISTTESSLTIVGRGVSVETQSPLLGAHQAANAGIAAVLAKQTAGATDAEIAVGIRNVTWPGRFEMMGERPFVVLDGAHNPAACGRLASLVDRFEYKNLHLVFGAMRDKDHAAMCRALPTVDRVSLARPDVSRAHETDILATIFDRETDATVREADSVSAALEGTIRAAGADDFVLVTGSLYTVAEARSRWTRTPVEIRAGSEVNAHSRLQQSDIPRREREENGERLVHRTVRLHARRDEAATIKETMLSMGGYCGVSGIKAATEHVELVLSGTLDQYRMLVNRLRERGDGWSQLARQVHQSVQTGGASAGHCSETELPSDCPWEDRTAVMGILNVTPDSLYDGGRYQDREAAVSHAREMVAAGVDIIDIGGESTRPGADPLPADIERQRVIPVVESLAETDTAVSIDTHKPEIAEAALAAGADIVNDVTGLADARMRRLVAEWDVPAVVMHSLSAPVDPDRNYEYDDVVADVLSELTERLLVAERAGIDRSQLLVDPGLGFGKRTDENYELLDRLDEFQALGTSVLVGHSRKSMFTSMNGDSDRLAPTLAATALAVERGADVVRVHDVPENVAAVATATRTVERRL